MVMKKEEKNKEREEIKQQIQKALQILEEYKKNEITLKRPVFFVPGWTDEKCTNWQNPYKSYIPIKEWIEAIVTNYEQVIYITFTITESKQCKTFFDFGKILKKKVEDAVGNNAFDIVGHSMGGLDIRSAITDYNLKNVFNCITVATPHKGSQYGDLGAKYRDNLPEYHKEQCRNLDHDHKPIKTINKVENRRLFLERVNKLYQFKGTLDPVAWRVAEIDTTNLVANLCNKITTIEILGAAHSSKKGITRDLRVIRDILNILIGIEPEMPNYNYGYVYKKTNEV